MDPASNNLTSYRPGPAALAPGSSAGNLGGNSGLRGEGLIDVLDRVLDKGVVIAGDIRINLLDIELLTIKVRLLIASADKAKEMGIDWWTRDPHLSSDAQNRSGKAIDGDREKGDRENKALRERIEKLESQLKALTDRDGSGAVRGPGGGGASQRLQQAAGRRS